MSYDKDINNHTVKFEDEKSYLNCRLDFLEYCKSCEDSYHGEGNADTLTFYGFIDSEMYYSNTCTVESIEPTQYTSNQVYVGSDTTPIGFALGGGNPSETVSVSSYGTYTTAVDYGAFGTGDVHISGNLIVDGGITWGGGSNFSPGPGNYEQPGAGNPVTFTTHESPKEEPPEDPIDNRFDILDL
jgi:hypothetical protein